MAKAMGQINQVWVMALGIARDTEACYNCAHFQAHYTRDGALIYRGSCCYPRLKTRKLCDTCEHFEDKKCPAE